MARDEPSFRPYIPTPALAELASDTDNMVRYYMIGALGFRQTELTHRLKAGTMEAIQDLYHNPHFMDVALRRAIALYGRPRPFMTSGPQPLPICGNVPFASAFYSAFQTFFMAQIRCSDYYPIALFCCN